MAYEPKNVDSVRRICYKRCDQCSPPSSEADAPLREDEQPDRASRCGAREHVQHRARTDAQVAHNQHRPKAMHFRVATENGRGYDASCGESGHCKTLVEARASEREHQQPHCWKENAPRSVSDQHVQDDNKGCKVVRHLGLRLGGTCWDCSVAVGIDDQAVRLEPLPRGAPVARHCLRDSIGQMRQLLSTCSSDRMNLVIDCCNRDNAHWQS
jgi:hypothetical protein